MNSFAYILIPAEFLGLVGGKTGTNAAFQDFSPTLLYTAIKLVGIYSLGYIDKNMVQTCRQELAKFLP